MQTYLENTQLIEMFKGAQRNLALNREYVDSLNVFPVPDGDTGTNMGLTMAATIRQLDSVAPVSIKETAAACAKGALMGARGNSGVILSQIFKGMSEVLVDAKVLNTAVFAKALLSGAEKAYSVVTVPKEGTILTVIRVIGEYAVKIASRTKDFPEFFAKILKKGEETLAETPKLLPILAKAGVVDSGGQGLIFILTGMYNVLVGIEMDAPQEITAPVKAEEKFVAFENDNHDPENIHFTYCTEFFIINLHKHVTTADIDKLRDSLTKIGDCVLVVGDLETVKVHVHTNQPDKALGYALKLGELNLPKIENMREQNRKLVSEREKEKKTNGLIAISSGKGFRSMFMELGASDVLEGGQTMNPSINDIAEMVNKVNAENVFVLPNNKNIIMACEQAKELCKPNLVVIATVNIPQGISAAMSFDPDLDFEIVRDNMAAAYVGVETIQITHAVRDTEMDGFTLQNGDIIAIDKGIIAKGKNAEEVVLDALKDRDKNSVCLITLYYGEGVTEEAAENLRLKVEKEFPDSDVIKAEGGQAHYYYFVALE